MELQIFCFPKSTGFLNIFKNQYSIIQLCHNLFIHSHVVNYYTWHLFFTWTQVFKSKNRIDESYGNLYLAFWRYTNLFSIEAALFYNPTSNVWGFWSLQSSSTIVSTSFILVVLLGVKYYLLWFSFVFP